MRRIRKAVAGSPPSSLQQRAEEFVRMTGPERRTVDVGVVQELVNELRVRQEDMEAQNQQLRESQQLLEQSRDRYADLYDFAPLGYVTLDRIGRIMELNLTAASLLGMERSTLLGKPFAGFVAPDDRNAIRGHIRQCAVHLQPVTTEVRLMTRKKEWLAVQLYSIPIESGDGDAVVCRSAITDLTHRKRLEMSLQEMHQELEDRNARLSALTNELNQAEQRERHRVAQVLHDHLQQLVVGAKMQISTIQHRVRGAEARRELANVVDLLQQVISVSRTLTDELSPSVLYHEDLPEALRWLGQWFLQHHRLEVKVDVQDSPLPLREGLRVFIFHCVRELIFNVVKHAGVAKAAVQLRYWRGEGLVEVAVNDEGAGFDPWKIGPNKAGFGMFNVRHRVESLGGRMDVASAPGRGTSVRLLVPVEGGTLPRRPRTGRPDTAKRPTNV